MDKDESVNIFETQTGSTMKVELESIWDEKNKVWITNGYGEFGATRDLEHWGVLRTEAKSIDNDLMASVALVMRTINNIVTEDGFEEKLRLAVDESENGKELAEGQSEDTIFSG